jgi:hypothetical protein
VETAGKGNLQTRITSRLESGKQVVGPILAQTLVDWRLGSLHLFLTFSVIRSN